MLPGKNRFFSSEGAPGWLCAPETMCSWSPASETPQSLTEGTGHWAREPQNNPAGISPAAGLPGVETNRCCLKKAWNLLFREGKECPGDSC